MSRRFVEASFDELFASRPYMFVFYFVGTAMLGVIGGLLEARGLSSSLVMAIAILLVIPLHLVVYASKEGAKRWFRRQLIVGDFDLYRSVIISDVQSRGKREEIERLIIDLTAIEVFLRIINVVTLAVSAIAGISLMFFVERRTLAAGILTIVGTAESLFVLYLGRWLKPILYQSQYRRWYQKRVAQVWKEMPEKNKAELSSPALP